MIVSKLAGLTIMIVAPLVLVLYSVALFFYGSVIITISVLAVVVGLCGLVTWIGYTMFTEPVSARPTPSGDLDSLEPETINSPSVSERIAAKSKYSVITDCEIGEGTIVRDHVNLFKCFIGRDCKIESFVYIEEGVKIGDRVKIKSNVFIPTGVTIEDDAFIGPNATFTNDKHPRALGEWKLFETVVSKGASIGAHAVILPGIRIGEDALVGAGSVVTENVPPGATVVGNPARMILKSRPMSEN
jgi:UDP-2-acetamido-3-amino-2,3-dideoxy-glucuronate N-acetyltransferase